MLSNNFSDGEKAELIIYPTHLKTSLIEKCFVKSKFRKLDKSDIPGVSVNLFSFCVGIVGGMKLYNPAFSQSFGVNTSYLQMAISSVNRLRQRGSIFLSNQFPHIDPLYVTSSLNDFIYMGENKLLSPADNPYDRNKLTYTPYLKSNWSIVYIISFGSSKEFQENGLNHGYLTMTQNDAVQLCELICKGKFPLPINFQETQQLVDRLIDDATTSDSSDEIDHSILIKNEVRSCNDTFFSSKTKIMTSPEERQLPHTINKP